MSIAQNVIDAAEQAALCHEKHGHPEMARVAREIGESARRLDSILHEE